MTTLEQDWPYEEIEATESESAPSWLCPDQTCTCSENEQVIEPRTLAIMLCSPDGTRMAKARCRVLVNGILVNEGTPNADASGWITVKVIHEPETVMVEWAPAETPLRLDLPYRRRYYVNLCEWDPDEAARRRLHNLGFSWFNTLRQNIEDFQCEYDLPAITGKVDDVDDILRLYHDEAMIPITKRRTSSGSLDPDPHFKARGFALAFDVHSEVESPSTKRPQPPPSSPAGAGPGTPTGTVKPIFSAKTNLASILDIIDRREYKFEWVAVPTTEAGCDAIFWVFKDALMHSQTGRRWPCSPHEAQLACAKLQSTPAELPGWPRDLASGLSPLAPVDSIFLTPKLSDLRWAQAERAGQAIDPLAQNINGDPAIENAKLNIYVNNQIKPGWLVADPGKIWTLSNRLGGMHGTQPWALTYGWHIQSSKVKASRKDPTVGQWPGGPVKRAETRAGQWCLQGLEMAHDTAWIDYSQLLILAAGWCLVRPPGVLKHIAMRTKDVYTSMVYAPLVTADRVPLKFTEQPLPGSSATLKSNHELNLHKDVAERTVRLARIEALRNRGDGSGPMTA